MTGEPIALNRVGRGVRGDDREAGDPDERGLHDVVGLAEAGVVAGDHPVGSRFERLGLEHGHGHVVVPRAIEFASSGERGLAEPEDAFELEATSPALGTAAEFRAWTPADDEAVTDADAPVLHAARLYRALLDFHAADADRTAFLAADLDRILWAASVAVDAGDVTATDRKADALEAFTAAAGDHEIAALAAHALAEIAREHDDLPRARAIATRCCSPPESSLGR